MYSTPTMPSPAIRAMGKLRSGLRTSPATMVKCVPAVVGPERGDQRDHEPAEPARAPRNDVAKLAQCPAIDPKQIPAMATISTPLSHVKTN